MKRIIVFCMLLLLVQVTSVHAAKRVALVIGNGAYKDSPLRNPVNDASDMASKLRKLNFDVTLVKNANQRTLDEQIHAFRNKLPAAEIRLFYYAGHGLQVQGVNYLVPVGIEVRNENDIKYEAVDVGKVLDSMADAGKGVNIIVLDACRNNPFSRSFRSSSRGLAKMDAPHGSMIVYATSPGDVAADGDGRNGVFTEQLLKNIDRSGRTLEKVLKETGKGVMRATGGDQVPWTTSSVFDDVYLAGQGTTVASVPTYSPPAAQSPKMGSLRIESEPSGAQIFLNGNRIGRTPKSVDGLPTGRVTVRAEKSGYEPQEKITSVLSEQVIRIAFPLSTVAAKPGRLYVLPDSKDATIKILNIKPRYSEGMSLKPGKYHVEVSKAGFATSRQWVMLGAGQDLDVPMKLEKAAVASTPARGQEWTEPATGIEFVWVPEGCYQMGSNYGEGDEVPVHEVCVDGFWMGKYEVTQAEWRRVMGNNPSFFEGDRKPVEQVTWYDVKSFMKKLNGKGNGSYRLPTEAEWEYAARSGGRNEEYSGSNDIDHVAWYESNSGDEMHPVGGKAPNGLGLYDMTGNAWEWCEDIYAISAYSEHPRNNPLISGGSSMRVYRGGSWMDPSKDARTAYRLRREPDDGNMMVGFRLIRTY